MATATLKDFTDIGRREGFLAVVSTLRSDSTIQSSVVNAGVLAHPIDGSEVVGFVTYGKAKLSNLRARPQLSVVVRSGWQWVRSKDSLSCSALTTRTAALMANTFGSCFATCSNRLAVRMMTGSPTTARWPSSAGRRFSSGPPGFTAIRRQRFRGLQAVHFAGDEQIASTVVGHGLLPN
jgi:hypothetical protein